MKKIEKKPQCVSYLLLWYLLVGLSPLSLGEKEEKNCIVAYMGKCQTPPPQIHIRSNLN